MRKVLLFTMMFCAQAAFAQTKQFVYGNQIWYSYYPQIKFSKHWGLCNDWELHSKENFTDGVSQFVFRLAGNYYTNDNTKISAGYGYTNYYPGDNHKNISQPEHFIWEQVQWSSTFKKKRLMQWIRLEERFRQHVIDNNTLADYSDFSYRARYQALYHLPLSKYGLTRHHFAIALGDEVYINFGKKIISNYFDQNRLFAGISYMVNGHDNLVFGYMNLFQQTGAAQYKNLNVIRLSFYQNIDISFIRNKNSAQDHGL